MTRIPPDSIVPARRTLYRWAALLLAFAVIAVSASGGASAAETPAEGSPGAVDALAPGAPVEITLAGGVQVPPDLFASQASGTTVRQARNARATGWTISRSWRASWWRNRVARVFSQRPPSGFGAPTGQTAPTTPGPQTVPVTTTPVTTTPVTTPTPVPPAPTPTPTPTPTPAPTPTPTPTSSPGGGGSHVPAFVESDFLPRQAGANDLRLQDCGDDWFSGNDKYPGCTPRDSADGPFNGIGTFRVFCQYSHQAYDDPIVFPGGFGDSHLHLFFGNTTTDAATNLDTMANVGGSTCDGGIADRSAYWVPTLYDPSQGEIIEPWIFAAYYQSGFAGLDPATIQPFPPGLRMIAGTASHTPDTYQNSFGNGGRWGCFNGGGGPTNSGGDIPDCGGDRVTMLVQFPQCWDGRLDSPDHKSHMAAPSFGFGGSGASCPASHPTALPSILLQIIYQNNGSNSSNWRLVSDHYPTSEPGGASVHADFVNGWNPDIMNRWLTNCVKALKDCERSELGGGQALASRFFR